jgi:hypothetical protein
MRNILKIFLLLLPFTVNGQSILKPGFDPVEYMDVLRIAFTGKDSVKPGQSVPLTARHFDCRSYSPEMGLLNQWSFFVSPDHVALVNLRGTIPKLNSWMANFYSAMIPAKGFIQINDSTKFEYKVADAPEATVHLGWMTGLAVLAPSIVDSIRAVHDREGIKDFLIGGHSQGGALTFLVRSYLHYLQVDGKLPADIHFKSYCSAAPKPGNMQYAYDFDFITRDGWSFTVVNAADWVPESPITAQTLKDFNTVNPFVHAPELIKKQKWPVNWYLGGIYRKMNRAANGSRDKLQKYLGGTVNKMVKKALPGYVEPEYANTMNYMRAGTPIVLMPNAEYYSLFPNDDKNPFIHHMFKPYAWLLEHQYPVASGQ